MQKLLLTFFFLYTMSTAISSTAQSFEGVWIPVKQELNGQPLPADPQSKLTIQGGTYTFETAHATDQGEATYGDGKMDIYSREGANKGKHFKAIYTLEENQLTVCYNLAGDRYPENFETQGNALFFLCVFQRQQ
ncbi:TIGR03067 domain-containing protein [Parachryseolinea silvisoli]|uniref:TIGR03067 domain-containing protein n=1 Tax=Parachryseolinea silvisoli TaxID=2873601 RepID=UPI002265B930|nr:TIGR03067 domain-containing protein [Parachryseolinea silvisoli]MCD9015060.1 TIGR03067 domain-containing protein [Parachryseolinea silvisoli]